MQAAAAVLGNMFSLPSLSLEQNKKRKTEPAFAFFSLPEEINMHIITFLSAEDLCNLSRTSHDMKRFANESILWRKLCKKHGWAIPRSTVKEASYQFNYKRYFSEKRALAKPGCAKWNVEPKVSGTAPSKRFKHSATVFGKYIIFIGGQETDTKRFNDIIYYDTESCTFIRPTIRGDTVPNFSRHTATLVNGRIFVFGGFDGFGTNFDLSVYNPATFTWKNIKKTEQNGTFPPSRTNHAAAAVGNKMYLFGGNNNNEAGAYQVLDDFYCLDTDTLTWSKPETTGDIPCARSGHCMTAIGKKLYMFGGGVWNETSGWVEKFNDVYVFDAENNVWTKPATSGDVQTSTFAISFAVGRYLFVFGGGSKPKHCVTNDIYILDTANYTWAVPQFENADKPQARDMGTACVVGNAVYFMGGYAGGPVGYFDKLAFNSKVLFEPLPKVINTTGQCVM